MDFQGFPLGLAEVCLEDGFLILEGTLQLEQGIPFLGRGITSQPGLNEIHVTEGQFQETIFTGNHTIRVNQPLVTHDFHLGIGLLLGFDQLVRFVEARILDIVLPERDLREAKGAYFHAGLLVPVPRTVKRMTASVHLRA